VKVAGGLAGRTTPFGLWLPGVGPVGTLKAIYFRPFPILRLPFWLLTLGLEELSTL
jgi:hypothetical protein